MTRSGPAQTRARGRAARVGLVALASALLGAALAQNNQGYVVVDLPTTGLTPGWRFETYSLATSGVPSNILEFDTTDYLLSTRKTGVVDAVNVPSRSSAWPAPYDVGSSSNFYTVHWGRLRIQVTGRYRFFVAANDAAVLFINGNEVRAGHEADRGREPITAARRACARPARAPRTPARDGG